MNSCKILLIHPAGKRLIFFQVLVCKRRMKVPWFSPSIFKRAYIRPCIAQASSFVTGRYVAPRASVNSRRTDSQTEIAFGGIYKKRVTRYVTNTGLICIAFAKQQVVHNDGV